MPILHEYSAWMCPVNEELAWRPRGLLFLHRHWKMESCVRVKNLHEMRFWSEKNIEREPVGWFRFEEALKFNTLPENLCAIHPAASEKKTICCKESISQIIIIFENKEDEHRDIDPKISNWIETVCDMKPEEG